MPVTPSFSAYAKTPDLSGAYIGAQRNAIARENIAADAAASAARIQLGREQLAAAAVQNQMELEAKKEIYAKQAMQRSQEAEIEKAYRETQFGLKERELRNDEAISAMRIQEAARGFEVTQTFDRVFQERIAAGDSEDVAKKTAALQAGGRMPGLGALAGGSAKAPPIDAYTKSSAKLLEQDIARNSKELLDIPNTEKNLYKRKGIENSIWIDKYKLKQLLEPPSASAMPAPQQQFQVDPNSIPAGAPTNPNWSMYMGPQQSPQFPQQFPNVPMAQTNTPSLRILNVRRK